MFKPKVLALPAFSANCKLSILARLDIDSIIILTPPLAYLHIHYGVRRDSMADHQPAILFLQAQVRALSQPTQAYPLTKNQNAQAAEFLP